MKGDWQSKEREYILMQLDSMHLPFDKYAFTVRNGRMTVLGSGGFSYVYEAAKRGGGAPRYAIKVIGFQCKNTNYEQWETAVKTQKSFGSLSYPARKNILKVYAYTGVRVWLDETCRVVRVCVLKWLDESEEDYGTGYIDLYFVALERCEPVYSGGKQLNPPQLARDVDEQYRFVYQIGHALEDIHSRGMIHGDVKLENVFYSRSEKTYKLGDFGVSQFEDSNSRPRVSYTMGYAAPEMIGSKNPCYDRSVDVYSLGVMMYLLANKMRFPGSRKFYDRNDAAVKQYTNGYEFPDAEDASWSYNEFLRTMCSFYPEDRYGSIGEALDDFEGSFFDVDISIRRRNAQLGEMLEDFAIMAVIVMWLKGIIWAAVVFAVLAYMFGLDYLSYRKNRNLKNISAYGRKIWYIGLMVFASLWVIPGLVELGGLTMEEYVARVGETPIGATGLYIFGEDNVIKILTSGMYTGRTGVLACALVIGREKLQSAIAGKHRHDDDLPYM